MDAKQKLTEQAEAWREAFRDYATHKRNCASRIVMHPTIVTPTPPCDCDYDKWITAAVLQKDAPE